MNTESTTPAELGAGSRREQRPCSPCPIQKAFVKAVLHRCVDLEWNATQLAERAGVSKGHWSEIRNMKKSPTMEYMVRIAQAVGLEVSWTLK